MRDTLTDTAGTHTYSYDPDGRLTSVTNPPGGNQPDETFTYDSLGNRTSWNNNPATQVRYDGADRLTQDATYAYGYDNEGNLTIRRDRTTGATTRYTWDANHQLRTITNPDSTTTTYHYDPLGRRTATTGPTGTTYDVWAGANLRAALDPTGTVTTRLVTNPTTLNDTLATTTGGTTTYPLADGLNTTTATTTTAGTVTNRTTYSAYGIPNTTNPTNIAGYTGYQQDPTGLDYARARYYDPTTGRFLSQDPKPSTNAYAFVGGHVTAQNDPTGQAAGPVDDPSMLESAGRIVLSLLAFVGGVLPVRSVYSDYIEEFNNIEGVVVDLLKAEAEGKAGDAVKNIGSIGDVSEPIDVFE